MADDYDVAVVGATILAVLTGGESRPIAAYEANATANAPVPSRAGPLLQRGTARGQRAVLAPTHLHLTARQALSHWDERVSHLRSLPNSNDRLPAPALSPQKRRRTKRKDA